VNFQTTKRVKALVQCLLILVPLCLAGGLQAKNKVLGRIQFAAANKAAKSSGVWIDGQYVGYLKELKGSRKILLLPGKHQIEVRQNGYQNFAQEVNLLPGQTDLVSVAMQKDPGARYGIETATVKLSGRPDRAAVFVDKQFVGHVDQFSGMGHGMLLTPGKHEIRISLPGYESFETEVTLRPHQKLKLKTNLMPESSGTQG
jgi:PEGA domain